ncbi:MAG: peptidoglycan-binding protein [Deltaproteobacteria bacterium]|nr:peptidoglycan-binding protein [Deltaproteobacteria bacterium]
MKTTNKLSFFALIAFAIMSMVVGPDWAAPVMAANADKVVAAQDMLPPDAKPGECYARVYVPPAYKTTQEKLLKKEASERLEIIPAKYEWVEERVLVKEASARLELVPATYGWKEEKVLVQPESTRMETVPAVYETKTEEILESPAQTMWKKGRGPVEKLDNATGEIMCLVQVPAKYKKVTKTVLEKPATTKEVKIPAEYKIVRKQVMLTPPTTRPVEIPAEYTTVKVRKLVSPAEVKRIQIPAEYQMVTKVEKISDGRMEWRRILCETNTETSMSKGVIQSIQEALKKAGHNPGPIDGVVGEQTMRALREYQQKKGLAMGGITYETAKSLGVDL